MSAEIFRIVGIGLISAIATAMLRQSKPEIAAAVGVTGTIVALFFIADMLQDTLSVIQKIGEITGMENGLIKTLLKIVGIGYLTEFSSNVLCDFGVPTLADKVVLAGKLTMLTLSLPLLLRVLAVLNTFLRLI